MRHALLLALLVPALALAGCTEAVDGAKGTLDDAKAQLDEAKRTLDETRREIEDTKARYDLLRGANVLAAEEATVELAFNVSGAGVLLVEPTVTTRTGPVPASNVTRVEATLLLAVAGDVAPSEARFVGCEVLACVAAAPSDGYLVFRLDEADAPAYRLLSDRSFERWDGSAWAPAEAPLRESVGAQVEYFMDVSDFMDRVQA